jgi:hypothetical protein
MAQFPKIDEEFKQNVSAKFQNAKEKVSDAILKEDGSLDTEKIGNAVTDTAKKLEDGVRDSYRKFSEAYVKDGTLDKEKLSEAANRTYRKAGRGLATRVSKLADFLTNKFGVQGQNGDIVDTEIVTETPAEEAVPVADAVPADESAAVAEEPVEITVQSEE